MIQNVKQSIIDEIEETVKLNIHREGDCIYCPALPLFYCGSHDNFSDPNVMMRNDIISYDLYKEIYREIYKKLKNVKPTK